MGEVGWGSSLQHGIISTSESQHHTAPHGTAARSFRGQGRAVGAAIPSQVHHPMPGAGQLTFLILCRSCIPFGNISSLARAIPFLKYPSAHRGFSVPDGFCCALIFHTKHPPPPNCQTATQHTTPPRHHTIARQCYWWLWNPALAGRGSESKTWPVETDVSHSTVNGRAHSAGFAQRCSGLSTVDCDCG